MTRRHFLSAALKGTTGFGLAARPLSLRRAAGFESWKAGLAKVPITPRGSLWMAGYAARAKPSEGTLQELYARALALEDKSGGRAVLVTTDLLGFTAAISGSIAERVQKRFDLPRDRLLLTSSHTHGGPVVDRMLSICYEMTPKQWSEVEAYSRELEDKVVGVIGAALRDFQPARLAFGHAQAAFAVNRRAKTEGGFVIGVNTEGPVDYDVPMLRVEGEGGKLRGIVFGYACHNTSLGPDIYQFGGDYAGFAEAWLERHHPDALALFVAGCGADINPHPRGSVEHARQHGETLARAVDKALAGSLNPVRTPLKSSFRVFSVSFATPPSRAELKSRMQDRDRYVRKHAQEMLAILDREGRLPSDYPYPLQVWQFGEDLTLIATAGEVVVDYALRLKRELGPRRLWIAAYANDVFAYIPSVRVLQEGGYEAGSAMIYYGQPGPFAPNVEETIVGKIHETVKKLRRH